MSHAPVIYTYSADAFRAREEWKGHAPVVRRDALSRHVALWSMT